MYDASSPSEGDNIRHTYAYVGNSSKSTSLMCYSGSRGIRTLLAPHAIIAEPVMITDHCFNVAITRDALGGCNLLPPARCCGMLAR